MARSGSSGTAATKVLAKAGIPHVLRPYPHERGTKSYGLEAATALGVSPDQVFKTLLANVDGELVVAVVPVSRQLDLKALACAVGGKRAEMADPSEAERATGYVVGGISPLGQRRTLPTVVDESAVGQASILISAGRRGLDVELSPSDLIELTNARVAPIGRTQSSSSTGKSSG